MTWPEVAVPGAGLPPSLALVAPAPPTWVPVDLVPYLDGTHTPPTADLLRRSDGQGLVYPGRVHWLAGEPGSLKSWLALLACTQQIHAGHTVIYVDFEDGAAGIVGRLLALGVSADQIQTHFSYLSPEGTLGYRARHEDQLAEMAEKLARRVAQEGKVITFDPMSARDRRIVHMALKDIAGVRTESHGEGQDRRVQIIPVKPAS